MIARGDKIILLWFGSMGELVYPTDIEKIN